MISLRAELPNKEDDYVQRNRRLVAKKSGRKVRAGHSPAREIVKSMSWGT